jgi:hypothetical protein
LFFARALLGLDPTRGAKSRFESATDVLEVLREETQYHGAIERISVEGALDALSVGAPQPALLVDKANHIHVLLGKIDVQGQSLYQFIHGDSPVTLLSRGEALSIGFRTAWRLSGGGDGVVVDVGSNPVHFDKLFENFGEVPYDAKVDCTWLITNRGHSPIVIGRPSLSCGCTTTDLVDKTELLPNVPHRFRVTVQSANAASLRHLVLLSFVDKQTTSVHPIPLHLFGSQRELKKVSPKSLDFGTVLPGRAYSRSITIHEVPTERFAIQKIVCGNVPMEWKIDESRDSLGYRIYIVTCNLIPAEAADGRQEGVLTITTNSRFAPSVVVPVSFEVAPLVTLRPSVIALGDVPIGQRVTRFVEIDARDSAPVSVTVDEPTEGIQVDVPAPGEKPEMRVHCVVPKVGIWQGVIKGKVAVGKSVVPIEVPCVGVGVNP